LIRLRFAPSTRGARSCCTRPPPRADDYPGQYPPDDTGCDGLTIAKVLTAAGEISGYQHTFSLDDALKALGVTPVITGVTSWYQDMFNPTADGRVHPTGGVAGGHEFVVDEIDAEHGGSGSPTAGASRLGRRRPLLPDVRTTSAGCSPIRATSRSSRR
jgi:hypothetical protein